LVRGYRVKVSRTVVDAAEAHDPRATVAKVIAKSMQGLSRDDLQVARQRMERRRAAQRLPRQHAPMATAPDNQISYFARTNFHREGKLFGIRQADRLSHIYIIGKTGVGKSTLLEVLV